MSDSSYFQHTTLLNATAGHHGPELKAEADQMNILIKEAVMFLKSTLPEATTFILTVGKARTVFAKYAIGRTPKQEYDEILAMALEARSELNKVAGR